jgi:hypothetical protein
LRLKSRRCRSAPGKRVLDGTRRARMMPAEIYNWFTTGVDTADLKDAKALLDELSKLTRYQDRGIDGNAAYLKDTVLRSPIR